MNPRLRALCDLQIPGARESMGLHDYDGVVQDLSPDAVRRDLDQLGQGPAEADRHDEAHLQAGETAVRTELGLLELHRSNPLYHLDNLDLAVYDREYAPGADRADARRRHLDAWPDAVEGSIAALDRVAAPVAKALLPAVRGLVAGLDEPGPDGNHLPDDLLESARAAHTRLVTHLEQVAATGPVGAALGADALRRLLSDTEALPVDLARLARTADMERDRLSRLLVEACGRLEPGVAPSELVPRLTADHPDPEGIYAAARAQIDEATAFTTQRDLLTYPPGECLVGPAPPSRRWAMAMMAAAAPYEAESPSWYYVSPPDPSWPHDEQEEWLSVFSETTLPAITVHEVMPGHFAHLRVLRSLRSDVRRCVLSTGFIEGWAHYAEELFVEEGFRADDPRFTIGMCVEALVRVTRLAVSIGIHAGDMSVADATARFETDAFLQGPAARAEAERATYDPTYGRYTWGKLEIQALRDEARARWGKRFSLKRFHDALLALGAPPLGLMGAALGDA